MKPDWKKPEDYHYTKQLDLNGWAFEFLRRNPAFLADCEHLRKTYSVLASKYGPFSPATKQLWLSDPSYWYYDSPLHDGEALNQWRTRSLPGDRDPTEIPLKRHVVRKWGLARKLPDPTKPSIPGPDFSPTGPYPLFPTYDTVGGFFEGDLPREGADMESWPGPYRQRHGYAVIVYDLSLSLKQQLHKGNDEVKRLAKKQKKLGLITPLKPHTPGNFPDTYTRYLRILDAQAEGVYPADMAPVLHPHEENADADGYPVTKKIWESQQTARWLVESGYLNIPLFNTPSGE